MIEQVVNDLIEYDRDTGFLHWKDRPNCSGFKRAGLKAGMLVGSMHKSGYLVVEISNVNYLVHRVAWLIHYGKWPNGQIDHINGIRTDNRIKNLRDVSPRDNASNTHKHRSGKLLGACYDKDTGFYLSSINLKGNSVYLGRFTAPEEANMAYKIALENEDKFESKKQMRCLVLETMGRSSPRAPKTSNA